MWLLPYLNGPRSELSWPSPSRLHRSFLVRSPLPATPRVDQLGGVIGRRRIGRAQPGVLLAGILDELLFSAFGRSLTHSCAPGMPIALPSAAAATIRRPVKAV